MAHADVGVRPHRRRRGLRVHRHHRGAGYGHLWRWDRVRSAEQSGDAALRHRQPLARRIDRQHIAIPTHHDGMRLHRIVILDRRLVGCVNALRRQRQTRLDIAAPHLGRVADANSCWRSSPRWAR